MSEFIENLNDIKNNEAEILKILKEDADRIYESYPAIKESVFNHYPVEVKMLLQSNPNFFWGLWEYCEEKQTVEQEDSEIVQSLRKNGAHIIESYFSEEELHILRQNWEYAFMSFPDMSKIPFQNKRFKRAQQGGVTYIKGGPDDGRTRIMYFRPYKLFSIKLKDLLVKNTYLNKIVQEYFYLKNTFRPSQIMMEGLKPTRFNRTDKYWHIDNLSDQFKVMIVLEDMTEDEK